MVGNLFPCFLAHGEAVRSRRVVERGQKGRSTLESRPVWSSLGFKFTRFEVLGKGCGRPRLWGVREEDSRDERRRRQETPKDSVEVVSRITAGGHGIFLTNSPKAG
ncbi:hypothetical protein Isop_2562 [Isosphaera pallida ATCC 43644]|uniref:Uncharacterized protein n=1 Tax=Isosphaera pallida (strain ATCC 43644 / DSM 9630 / IS1B) TaxID=575540 RepID=E8QYD8_ISOPI|nr:hypothetical protein Isop_2562 [Isosphaera pallida ATCC 43644]